MSFVVTTQAGASASGSVLDDYADANSPLLLGSKLIEWFDPGQGVTLASGNSAASWTGRKAGVTIPAAASGKPTYQSVGFGGFGPGATFHFDGSTQYFVLSPAPGTFPANADPGGMAVIGKAEQTAGSQVYVGYGQGSSSRTIRTLFTGLPQIVCNGGSITGSGVDLIGAPHGIIGQFGTTVSGYADGAPLNPPSAPATAATTRDRFVIGTDAGTTPSLYFQGYIADVFILTGAPLTTAEVNLLSAYMKWRAGL